MRADSCEFVLRAAGVIADVVFVSVLFIIIFNNTLSNELKCLYFYIPSIAMRQAQVVRKGLGYMGRT